MDDNAAGAERLHGMLTRAGVSDDEIKAGVQLTQAGLHKAAAALGVAPDDVPSLINAIRSKMDQNERRLDDDYAAAVASDSDRFSYEADYLKNVTVRDSRTGKTAFLRGAAASDLMRKLDSQPGNEQQVLAAYAPLMEARKLREKREAGGFDDEIAGNGGSYNMPWKIAGQHGFMTVSFALQNGKPVLDVVMVRDSEGNEVDPPDAWHHDLMQQARDFIGHE